MFIKRGDPQPITTIIEAGDEDIKISGELEEFVKEQLKKARTDADKRKTNIVDVVPTKES